MSARALRYVEVGGVHTTGERLAALPLNIPPRGAMPRLPWPKRYLVFDENLRVGADRRVRPRVAIRGWLVVFTQLESG